MATGKTATRKGTHASKLELPNEAFTAVVIQDLPEDWKHGRYGVGKVVRGQKGYLQFNIPTFVTYAEAEEAAFQMNKQRGISHGQATMLVLQSM